MSFTNSDNFICNAFKQRFHVQLFFNVFKRRIEKP